MLTAFELAQVDQATDVYCEARHVTGEAGKRAVRAQMLIAFVSRKKLNLQDAQVGMLVRLENTTLIEILKDFHRTE